MTASSGTLERRWAAIAFALAVIVLLGVFGVAWRSGERLAADSDWRQHTYEVIGEVRGLLNALIDAETGERGYLLTGDAGFLAPFRSGAAAVGPRLASLRQLTADNPRQQGRLDALEPLARAELAQLEDAVDVRGRAGASGVSLAASIESRRLMDRLRARVADLEDEEAHLLAWRDRALQAAIRQNGLSLAGGALASALLLGAAFWLWRRENARRLQAEGALQRLNARLEAANADLESFSYSVSHDLRAPLRAIDGFSHALLEDAGERLTPDDQALLARVRAGAQRMAQLIDDLLRLARISRLPMTVQEVDLSALAETIAGELRGRDPHRPARWEIEDGVHARGDEQLLRVVLENLLGNAWKFTRRQTEPRIAFGSENGGPESVYFVRDNGAGFDMTFADKLFGPFQRLHSEREFEGTGIGLATVARVVHIHGGQVWAESELGRGAIFRFTLGGGVGRPAAARARDTP
ncbi:MAG TPA: CHASE3 domain-containing protein [Steroidobacteraceae bacterium]|nr:CHASE3 domain-containing protein [Steroidobacteraceae bacterium]